MTKLQTTIMREVKHNLQKYISLTLLQTLEKLCNLQEEKSWHGKLAACLSLNKIHQGIKCEI